MLKRPGHLLGFTACTRSNFSKYATMNITRRLPIMSATKSLYGRLRDKLDKVKSW